MRLNVKQIKPTIGGRSLGSLFVGATVGAMLTASLISLGTPGGSQPAFAQVPATPAPLQGVSVSLSGGTATTGQSVTLTATATTPNAGATIAGISFDFGDGTPAVFVATVPPSTTATATTSHVYANPGVYLSTARATDTTNQTGASQATIQVTGPTPTPAPTPTPVPVPLQNVSLSAGGIGSTGLPISLTGSAGTPNIGQTITGFSFDFGDGTGVVTSAAASGPTATATVSHTYASPGTYVATVAVLDSSGQGGRASGTVLITPLVIVPFVSPAPAAPLQATTAPIAVSVPPVSSAPVTASVASSAPAQAATPVATEPPAATPPAPGFQVTYQSGFNLVGGPAGTIIPGTTNPLFSFRDGAYQTFDPGTPLQAGFGYWVLFPATASVTLPLVGPQRQSVTVPANSYIMIGNPGDTPATVTGADFVYTYDPATGYQLVQGTATLQPGQGAFAFSFNGGTIVITNTAR